MGKVAIVGSRKFPEDLEVNIQNLVSDLVFGLPDGTVLVSGGADGVDSWAEDAAESSLLNLTKEIYPIAEGIVHAGLYAAAAYARNQKIVDAADEVIAVRFNGSKGTTHTIEYARKKGKKVTVIDITIHQPYKQEQLL